VRLGLCLPGTLSWTGQPRESADVVGAAVAAEEAEFDSVWAFDAIGRGFFLPEPLSCLAAAAAATSRIGLGTGVLQLPLRNPVELAHRVLTTQYLCGGRLVLGVGAGSTAADFAALGADFGSRFTAFESSVETMRRLWNGETVRGARLDPGPDVLGGPPVLIGSRSAGRWIARSAEYDVWITSGAKTSWQQAEQGIATYRAAGGDRALMTNIRCAFTERATPAGPENPVELTGSSADIRERLARLAGLGYDDVIVRVDELSRGTLMKIRDLVP